MYSIETRSLSKSFGSVIAVDDISFNVDSGEIFGFLGPNGETSRVGITKTAPSADADVAQVQYAVFSCAHFSNGYFHAYDIASTLSDLDFWIHMGDYVRTKQRA